MTTLAITSRIQFGYVVRELRKKEKILSQTEPNSLSEFSVQMDKLTSLSMIKNNLHTHNQLHTTALLNCQDSCIYCSKLGNNSCSIIHKLTGQQCASIRPIDIVARRCDVCRAYSSIKQWPPTSVVDH